MPSNLYTRYLELQRYVGWTAADSSRILDAAVYITPHLPELIDDFYAEIDRHESARRVITGGPEQVSRLKGSLTRWLSELLAGTYDEDYVAARWRVGQRHVEIGLDQVFTNAALSRLRRGMQELVCLGLRDDPPRQAATSAALHMLIDLDLAIIEDAYQSEYVARNNRMERLATIGKVAGGVAHELRNPLNVVKTSVYYLLNARNPAPDKIREHLTRVERQVTVADGVIATLSDFARLPAPERKGVQFREAIREALEIASLPATISTVIDIDPAAAAVMVDPNQLQIVLGNLVRNARDAMPQGGELSFHSSASPGWVELTITDTGVGIAPDDLRRIMEPFFSTKARGIGLGLALSRAILERNCGSLQAASTVGQGSTFTIRLEPVGGPSQAGSQT